MSDLRDVQALIDQSQRPDDGRGADGAVYDDIDDEVGNDDDDEDEEDDDEEETSAGVYLPAPEGHVKLRPSMWRNILSTVYVDYPPELGRVRSDESMIKPLGQRKLAYTSHWERVCIKNAFIRSGFTKTTTKAWTCMWSKHQNDTQMKGLNCLQKVNHFQASWCIGRKDRLARTMQAMMRKHGEEFNFHPQSYILPAEREALHRHIANEAKSHGGGAGKDLWIKKPCASSCGQGIAVLTGGQVTAIGKSKKLLVQKYVADPYLIDGNKFDLRLYVVVTGVDPLRVYLFKEGLTRISTAKYSLKNLNDRFAHLTNYSINKKSKEFKRSMANDGDIDIKDLDFEKKAAEAAAAAAAAAGGGGELGEDGKKAERSYKWSYTEFKSYLAQKEGVEAAEATHKRIEDLLVKTMIASESVITPHLHSSANYRTNCFELFGCDVMLDSKLKPHLVEVNISPSLMGGAAVDKLIKGQLIADILHTVGVYPHDPKLLRMYDDKDVTRKASSLKRLASAKSSKRSQPPVDTRFEEPEHLKVIGAKEKTPPQNPFSFNSMSKMMASQDAWRRKSEPSSISMKAIGNNDAVWVMLLMIADEFKRGESTQLVRVHPVKETAAHYNKLYFSSRFSDQLLAKWVIEGGEGGPLRKWIPDKYLPEEELQRKQAYEAEMTKASKGLRGRSGGGRLAASISRDAAAAAAGGATTGSRTGPGKKSPKPHAATEPPLLRPAAARTSAIIASPEDIEKWPTQASFGPSRPGGRGSRGVSAITTTPNADAEATTLESPFWEVDFQSEGSEQDQEAMQQSQLQHHISASAVAATMTTQQQQQQPSKGQLRPMSRGSSGITDRESSSSPMLSNDAANSDPDNAALGQQQHQGGDPVDMLLFRADDNLSRVPLDDVDLETLRRNMLVQQDRHRRVPRELSNNPVLKGKDLSLPHVGSRKGGASAYASAAESLGIVTKDHDILAPPSSTLADTESRMSRHLRQTVKMQRQAEKSISALSVGNMLGGGLADASFLHRSGQGSSSGDVATNGERFNALGIVDQQKTPVSPKRPTEGAAQSSSQVSVRRSGVKLRSRSKPAVL